MEMVKAKSIIAHFLGMEVHEIDDSTVMNHTAVRSSLLLHRMYAALADEGYILEDPTSIENFGDLCRVISASGNDTVTKGLTMDLTASQSLERSEFFSSGIDIFAYSHSDLACHVSTTDIDCGELIYEGWLTSADSSEFGHWDFGTAEELPGITIGEVTYRDANADLALD